MTRVASILACAALLLASGCGSSSSSNSSSKRSSATSSAAAAATSSAAAAATSSTTPSAKLVPVTKPKYGSVPSSTPTQSGLVQVAYRDIAIHPDVLRVKVGSTIKWTNYDPLDHNVTSEGGPQAFASKNFGEGGTFEIKALKPGVIHYECTIHPASMNGTIEVVR